MKVFKNVLSSLKGSKYGKKDYMDLFGLMYDLFNIARKDGVIGLEKEIDEPIKSPVFSKHKLGAEGSSRARVHHRLFAHDGQRRHESFPAGKSHGCRTHHASPRKRRDQRRGE